ncbi:secreted RxLR effector peptide protein, putative [Phytophthora infestans T30-4]
MRALMRAYFVYLLMVATLAVSSGAISTTRDSIQVIDATSPDTLQSHTTTGIDGPTKRYLRDKETENENANDKNAEKRASTSQLSIVEKVLKVPLIEKNGGLNGLSRLSSTDKLATSQKLQKLAQPVSPHTEKIPFWIKKHSNNKFWRNFQYNAWIWTKKTPEWVETIYPAFAKVYDLFFQKRMTRGYKYA